MGKTTFNNAQLMTAFGSLADIHPVTVHGALSLTATRLLVAQAAIAENPIGP